MDWKNVSFLLIGLFVGIVLSTFLDPTDIKTDKPDINNSSQSQLEPTIRNIKQNPEQFEGKTVRLTGRSNSLSDFIANGGYKIDMDCSQYPDFEYSTKFQADFVVEYIPGELGPKARCVSAAKKISE